MNVKLPKVTAKWWSNLKHRVKSQMNNQYSGIQKQHKTNKRTSNNEKKKSYKGKVGWKGGKFEPFGQRDFANHYILKDRLTEYVLRLTKNWNTIQLECDDPKELHV